MSAEGGRLRKRLNDLAQGDLGFLEEVGIEPTCAGQIAERT